MTRHAVALLDITTGDDRVVAGTVIRDMLPSQLTVLEESWSQYRVQLKKQLRSEGLDTEHSHWNWNHKFASARSGYHRLVALELAGEIQGMMAVLGFPRTARQASGRELLYVEYVETAPWNLRPLQNHRRYAQIGFVLIAEAIAMSADSGFEGRIGLHSLPQAEVFYREKIGMTDYGPDANYHKLCYFEFVAKEAVKWRQVNGL